MLKRIRVVMYAVFAALLLTAGTASAAPDYEWDTATSVSEPPRGIECVYTIPTTVNYCFDPDGDKIYVYDGDKDGKSAVADWNNIIGGSLYRQGGCRNSLGKGHWGVCNKNFYESTDLYVRWCKKDVSANTPMDCEPQANAYRFHTT